MLGCDFNTNIPRIGPKKSWDLMNKHNSIEEILSNNSKLKDTSDCLNYKKCRELFSKEFTNLKHSDIFFNIDMFNKHISDVIEQYDLLSIYSDLILSIKHYEKIDF